MYTALIVEPRNHPCLPIVLENFDRNLSDEWSFLIFHGSDNKSFIDKKFGDAGFPTSSQNNV